MNNQCTRAEILAGAIALGEAGAQERDEYRGHIASCPACLRTLGGEREIERVMAIVAQARESETWEPLARRASRRSRTLRGFWGAAAVLAAALVVAFGARALIATNPKTVARVTKPATVARAPVVHVALEKPAPAAAATPPRVAKVAPRRRAIVVVHNVVTRRGNALTQTTTTQTTEVADAAVPQMTAPASNVPIWRRGEAMPSQHVSAAQVKPEPVLSGRAESIAVAPMTVVRDVVPLGGDAAIVPHPTRLAIEEDAQGTTAFEVMVDERGAPTKCTITKSSGFLVLDVAVCKAAMAARYSPRTLNGKATVGIYRDAFTFRASDIEPSPLPAATPR
ncbi:MAG TPA: TonB family protein [Candidatus Baltobacteraceae bacterium]|nr:TonB family protein [Candidatus Baltobacteraceae bacterium]